MPVLPGRDVEDPHCGADLKFLENRAERPDIRVVWGFSGVVSTAGIID